MKDWKKELEIYKTNMGELNGDGAWMANYYPAEVVETLLSEQEAENKKQMRKAIEEAYRCGIDAMFMSANHGDGIDHEPEHLQDLFKKFNCEKCHHHVTSKSDGKCVKCGEQVLVEKD